MAYINGRQYEWGDLTLILGGRNITGFRGIKYSEKIEREALYAKGTQPHSIQSGNVSYEGEITMTQSEYEALESATKGQGIFSLCLDALVSYGNPSNGDVLVHDRIEGLRFTESAKEWKQGDKFIEITLPFIAMNIARHV